MPATKLTDSRLRSLLTPPFPSVAEEWYDKARYPGLMVRRSPKGVVTFTSFGRVHGTGKKFKQKVGRYPSTKLVEAYAAVEAHRKLLERGIHPADHERAEQELARQEASLTVERIVGEFVEHHCRPRNRTWREQEQVLRRVLCRDWQLGERPIKSIQRREIGEKLRGMIGPNGERGIRANRVQSTVSKMFKWAAAAGYIYVSPVYGMERMRPENDPCERVLSAAEIRALWAATGQLTITTPEGSEVLHPLSGMLRLALLTGQRMGTGFRHAGEIRGMRWDEVDLKAGVWTISVDRIKNKKPHTVPLCSDARQLLMQLPRRGPFVFCLSSPDKPYNNPSRDRIRVNDLMRTELEKADLEYTPWKPHDLRRTVRTGLADCGVHWEILHRVQNHMSIFGRMEKTYNQHDYMGEKREALKKWEQKLREIIAGSGAEATASAGHTAQAQLSRKKLKAPPSTATSSATVHR